MGGGHADDVTLRPRRSRWDAKWEATAAMTSLLGLLNDAQIGLPEPSSSSSTEACGQTGEVLTRVARDHICPTYPVATLVFF
ncbi:hypothetical protein EYF80_028762 [Liparis tanakae]|uniref:Uncharacterized protein n=1 Tax=Liparis tanakae TaxID=230148 RepID=A0A4Z2H808_9TELE|nr:hypothetical protein EYF80_028762 [Liparis tanakae]